ncbi:MAG TPA: S53 family peptidase [Acidimicrobiales bacterium]|nr:S53 family peptidase [Acidimicrobiales bacterium]
MSPSKRAGRRADRPGRRWVLAGVATALSVPMALLGQASASAAGAGPGLSVTTPTMRTAGPAAPHLPRNAVETGSVGDSTPLDLTLTLASADPTGLASMATQVSDPGSPLYHHFLSTSAFAARFGATAATVSKVRAELRSMGLTPGALAPNHLSIEARATAGVATRAFHTRLRAATVSGAGVAGARALYANVSAPTLPSGVTDVLGLDNLTRAHTESVSGSYASAAGAVTGAATGHVSTTVPVSACPSALSPFTHTPSQLSTAYGMGGLYGSGSNGSGQTIDLFELADYSSSDITAYESCMGISNVSITKVPVDGGSSGIGAGTAEATFDLEDVIGLAPAAKFVVYEAPNTGQGLLDNYSAIVNSNAAQVISTSWGICEADDDPALAQAENNVFQQAAVQGQTIFAASGDSGSEDCYDASSPSPDTSLQVDDPASQPLVTGVGGTTLSSVAPLSESAWNAGGGSGGGGISTFWSMPAWQDRVAGSQSSGVPCGAASGDCRQVPDVSASADPGHGYAVYCTAGDCSNRGWESGGGTSMASPLWAAAVALINESCPTSKRAGFINPVLYSTPAGFNDVTSGSNDLTHSHGGSYTAGPGYDMATGLGSPNFAGLSGAICAAAATGSTGGSQGGGGSSGGGSSGGGGSPAPTGAPGSAASSGYRFVAADGGVFSYGAPFFGSTGAIHLAAPIVGMAPTPDGRGYWLVARDGGIFTFGDAVFYGSTGAMRLAAPIVGMAASPDGHGYWLVASDGGIFTFGDAAFQGSAGALRLAAPIVGMAVDPATGGYWLVASDGGIFSYGAPFFGSTGAIRLAQPIVGMSAMPGGGGYRFVAADGGVFNFGDAAFYGSTGAIRLAAPVVAMVSSPDGAGYWLVARDGGVFTFGDAAFQGSAGNVHLAAPIVGATGT